MSEDYELNRSGNKKYKCAPYILLQDVLQKNIKKIKWKLEDQFYRTGSER